jgi:glycosyltransferase involved in cell wall biosynthesis
MQSTKPTVSICIPTYRRLHYLKEAVASARTQTFSDIEVLLGDDGDSPELRAWCLDQGVEDPRVRYQSNQVRLGLGGNWNAVSQGARGDYLVIIGDDDRLLPTFIARMLAATRPDTVVAFSNHFVIDAGGRRLPAETERFTREYGRAALSAGRIPNPGQCAWRNGVPMCASLLRTRDVQRLGFKTDINTPDLELFVRLAYEGAEFVFVPDFLVEYRMHPDSATAQGLTLDRLVEYLEEVPASEDALQAKNACLRSMLPGAVHRLIQAGDKARALRMIRSPYYPGAWTSPTIVFQRVAVRLPSALARPVSRVARLVARRLRAGPTGS